MIQVSIKLARNKRLILRIILWRKVTWNDIDGYNTIIFKIRFVICPFEYVHKIITTVLTGFFFSTNFRCWRVITTKWFNGRKSVWRACNRIGTFAWVNFPGIYKWNSDRARPVTLTHMKYPRPSDDGWPSRRVVRVPVNKRGFVGEFNRGAYAAVVYRLVAARANHSEDVSVDPKTVEIGVFSRRDGDRLPKNNIP